MITRTVLALLILLSATAFADTPSSEQLHKMFDDGNYTELLKQLRTILAQKDQSTVDRSDLLKLKGEALLRTKSDSAAADAFRDAAKAAKDDKQASLCRATEDLLRQSHSEIYMPRTHPKSSSASEPSGGISVIGPASRKDAFEAMFNDELAAKAHTIDAAKKATSLQPIVAVGPALQELGDLEQASTDSTEKSGALAKGVGDRARELIGNADKKLTDRLDELEKKAGESENPNQKGHGRYGNRRRGLNSAEITELQNMAATCDEITAACSQLGKALGPGAGDFAAESKTVAGIKSHAEELAKKHGPHTETGN